MNETMTENKTVKVGDIFEMSWGYDQTNVNFFQVTRMTPKGVCVREIGSKGVEGSDTGCMSQMTTAVKDSFLTRSQWCGDENKETFFKLKGGYKGEPMFSVKGRYSATLWDGKPTYESWYA